MKNFDYEISEQAFINVWDSFNNPEEITNIEEANKFLQALITETKGYFIVDHITGGNYDNVNSVVYDEPYFMIRWKDFNNYRIKYLNKEISDDELFHWSVFGNATYDYLLFKFNKLKFKKIKNHLYIALQLHLTNIRELEKWMKIKKYTLISVDDAQDFEIDYVFYEGEKQDSLVHICRVNNLPFYTNLLQPKERCCHPADSRNILLAFTYDEIMNRLNHALQKLESVENTDIDSLFDIGNRIRRIMEHFLKYFCVYNHIKINIPEKYSHILLGELKKAINKKYPDTIKQEFVNLANEFSHDSGQVFRKEDVQNLLSDSFILVKSMIKILQKHQ